MSQYKAPTVTEFVKALLKWEGYCGKKSNNNLEDFTANTSGKFSIFAKYFDDLKNSTGGPLNTRKQSGDYCALFPLYVACNLIGDVYSGFDFLCQTWNNAVDNCAAGVGFMYNYFGYWKRLYSEPAIGDIAFLKNFSGKITHVAIVIDINGTTITTIDGNWGNNVVRIKRDVSEYLSFGRPKYSEEPKCDECAELKEHNESLMATNKMLAEENEDLRAKIDQLESIIAEYKSKADKYDAIATIVFR